MYICCVLTADDRGIIICCRQTLCIFPSTVRLTPKLSIILLLSCVGDILFSIIYLKLRQAYELAKGIAKQHILTRRDP